VGVLHPRQRCGGACGNGNAHEITTGTSERLITHDSVSPDILLGVCAILAPGSGSVA
jgi:hypothetical protein